MGFCGGLIYRPSDFIVGRDAIFSFETRVSGGVGTWRGGLGGRVVS